MEQAGQLQAADGRGRAVAIAAALRRAARQSSAPVSLVSGGGGFRARKGDRIFWRSLIASLVLVVILPFAGASLYYGLIASNQYVTEFQFALRTGESSALDAVSGLAGVAASQQNIDSQVLVNFIPSRAMMEKLDAALDLRKVYSRGDVDWLSRFNPKRPVEDLERYWSNRVDASIEASSSIINVKVRAFTPGDSLALAQAIIRNCEKLVNDMTARSRDSALAQSKLEVERAEAALTAATTEMQRVRNAEGTLDAGASAAGIERIIGQLQLELARVLQQGAVSSRSMSPDSPTMKIVTASAENLRKQIAALKAQIAGAGDGGKRTLADSMSKLANQQTLLTLAQQRYANAAVQFETARIDVETQHAFLIDVAAPSLPQKALYPRRMWGWFIIVFPAFIIWSLLAGLAFLVRDHTAQ